MNTEYIPYHNIYLLGLDVNLANLDNLIWNKLIRCVDITCCKYEPRKNKVV